MLQSPIRKTVFFYCSQIWITNALSAPVFYFIWVLPESPTVTGFLGFYGLAILYGLILSFPSMCCFWAVAAYLFSRKWQIGTKKIVLSGCAILLTVAQFWLIFGKDDPGTLFDVIKMAICYLLTILAGIYGYRISSKAAS
jgi:hypothetical protein